jgi:hypothetical protein
MCTINFVEADVPHVAAERQRRRSLSAGRRLSDLEMLKKVRELFMYLKESLFANNAHTRLVLFSLAHILYTATRFLFWELRGPSPYFHIHASVSDSQDRSTYFFLQQKSRSIADRHKNVVIWTVSAPFLFWEYLFLIFALILCSVYST